MASFSNLKKSNDSDRLRKELEKTTQKTNSADDRFWKPEVDKTGNGYAVLRFLPAPPADGDDALPWVRVFDHGFKGPGGWYIENSLTTIGEADPVAELNKSLWDSGLESDKETARKQKRRLKYIANVLVVEDPKHPENQGKVFLFKFGKKIFDKINEAMAPEFQDEEAVNVFDFWKGANFKLKIRNVEGFQNYDKSAFDAPSKLNNLSDKDLEAIWNSEYSLKDFLDRRHFKSYDELNKRLNQVLGNSRRQAPQEDAGSVSGSIDPDDAAFLNRAVRAPKAQEKASANSPLPDDDDDDETLARFKKLALDD